MLIRVCFGVSSEGSEVCDTDEKGPSQGVQLSTIVDRLIFSLGLLLSGNAHILLLLNFFSLLPSYQSIHSTTTMKFTTPLVLLLAATASAFSPGMRMQQNSYLTSLEMSTAAQATAFNKPERVIREQLPTIYVYDHCPFCVRVRVALGLKNIKHNLHFMANDDVPTPTALVGKKIAPILVRKWNLLYGMLLTHKPS
jgi:hypothetical protein